VCCISSAYYLLCDKYKVLHEYATYTQHLPVLPPASDDDSKMLSFPILNSESLCAYVPWSFVYMRGFGVLTACADSFQYYVPLLGKKDESFLNDMKAYFPLPARPSSLLS